MNIGIYSGTFDPVHAGHISFALASIGRCKLENIFLLPEKNPRGKQNVTPIMQRTAQIEEAIRDHTRLKIMTLGMDRFTPRQTLPQLEKQFPGAKLYFLIGSDVVRTLPYRWPDLSLLLERTALIIGMRSGDREEEIEAVLKTLPASAEYTILRAAKNHLASSQLRSEREL